MHVGSRLRTHFGFKKFHARMAFFRNSTCEVKDCISKSGQISRRDVAGHVEHLLLEAVGVAVILGV